MFDKLKSRTEWQAYLLTIISLFLNHFLGWDMSPTEIAALVLSATGYGLSRGIAKHRALGSSQDGGKEG